MVSAIIGAILTKLVPFLFHLAEVLFSRLGRMIGGRFAYREFRKHYLNWIVTELRELRLTGIVSYDDTKKPQLEQVYVSLSLDERRGGRTGAIELEKILREHQRVAILGVPGAGKTTLLQYVALAYAREKAGDRKLRRKGILKERLKTDKWRLPIFVSLGAIADRLVRESLGGRDTTITDVIPRLLPPDFQRDFGNIAPKYFADQLKNGNCIVLLDGLDEVASETEFRSVVRAIESLVIRYRDNQYVVTSRIAGWRSGVDADFVICNVNDLTDNEIRDFIDSWYSAVERNVVIGRLEDESETERASRERRARSRADDLKRVLHENLGIRRLATNPMLLSIVALVHRSLATLPKERSKLYAECSKILLEQWDVSRGVRVDDTELSLDQKETIMKTLAFSLHAGHIGEREGARTAKREEVLKVIADILPRFGREKEDARHLLNRLIERSGIIVERQRDLLALAHFTFQECFTARYLADGDNSKAQEFLLAQDRILSNWWHEVILLYAGLLPDSSHFIVSIMESGEDDLCQQRLRIAALCLSESVAVTEGLRRLMGMRLLEIRTGGKIKRVSHLIHSRVLSYLVRLAKEQHWYRLAAEESLRDPIESSRAEIIQSKLLKALQDSQSEVRKAALNALSHLPESMITEELRGTSLVLMKDSDQSVRSVAASTLAVLAMASEEAILGLVEGLGDRSSVRESSLDALMMLADKIDATDRILESLLDLLREDKWEIQLAAMRVLARLASQASQELVDEFQHALTALLKPPFGSSLTTRRSVRRYFPRDWLWLELRGNGLKRICQEDPPDAAVEILRRILKSKDVRTWVSSWEIIRLVTEALGEIDHEQASRCSVIDDIVTLLGEERVQSAAIEALSRWAGQLSASRVATLARLMEARDSITRAGAIRAIGKLGVVAATDEIVEKLTFALSTGDDNARSAAASALVLAAGTNVRVSVTNRLLELVVKGDQSRIRCPALRSLGVLGRSVMTKRVLATILWAFSDRDVGVEIAAMEAIAQLGPVAAPNLVLDAVIGVTKDTAQLLSRGERYIYVEPEDIRDLIVYESIDQLVELRLTRYRQGELTKLLLQRGVLSFYGTPGRMVSRSTDPRNRSLRAAAILALLAWGRSKSTAQRVVKELYEIARSDRWNLNMVAIESLASLGTQIAGDEIFSRLLSIYREKLAQDLMRPELAQKFLLTAAENVPLDVVMGHLAHCLMEDPYMQKVSLMTLSALDFTGCAEAMRNAGIVDKAIAELTEDEYEIREKAWEVLLRCRIAEGIWE